MMVNVIITPILMKELFAWWNHEKKLHILIKIPLFIINFLRIHPFEDGNGRISRLITNYLLIKNNYDVVKYVAIEHFNLINKSSYFNSIKLSTINWDIETNNPDPFIIFSLEMLKNCYQWWKQNLEFLYYIKINKLNKREIVLLIINQLIENNIVITKQNIIEQLKLNNLELSEQNIKDSLKTWSKEGLIIYRKSNKFSFYDYDLKAINNKLKSVLNQSS